MTARVMTTARAAALLRSCAPAFARATVAQLRDDAPGLLAALPPTFADPWCDCEVRLRQFAESAAVARPALFGQALAWYKVAFAHRGVADDYLPQSLLAMTTALRRELPDDCHGVLEPLAAMPMALAAAPRELPSALHGSWPLADAARHFLLAILEGRADAAVQLVRRLLVDGAGVAQLHDGVLTPVLRELGRMWLMAEIPIADEHFGSVVVERVLSLLDERLPPPAAAARRVVTLAVSGDQHGLGLRMVAQRLAVAGHDVWHLGTDMPAADIEWMLADRHVDVLAMSASLLLQLGCLGATIASLRQGLGSRCPFLLVGGPLFAQVADLGTCIGADAAAADAEAAVRCLQALPRAEPER